MCLACLERRGICKQLFSITVDLLVIFECFMELVRLSFYFTMLKVQYTRQKPLVINL
jgi:hypothetical protein